mmetsp:Transcript_3730/g.5634  ORF Transcript_3730/g.5634 Transcript_3730/m.5634 type:complete len:331 (-) Transcript_3730:290-1282(-)
MSQGLIDMINRGHPGFLGENNYRSAKDAERRADQIAKAGHSKNQFNLFNDYQACDGYVKDVKTALVAMVLSVFGSIALILAIERIKLLFYQHPEKREASKEEFVSRGSMLAVRDLTKVYGGKVKAVNGISFKLGSNNEILGLLGANGAGKSSTFNMVTMQLQRTSGDIKIFGRDISTIESLSEVNITNQSDILWPFLSILEHFRVISMIVGQPNFSERFKSLTENLELDKPHKYPAILSGGNRRKLCTALTLFTCPRLTFFDEPTVGLDPVARRNLLALIKQTRASSLFTTHRLDEAEFLCSSVAIMHQGKILYNGPIAEIKDKFKGGSS